MANLHLPAAPAGTQGIPFGVFIISLQELAAHSYHWQRYAERKAMESDDLNHRTGELRRELEEIRATRDGQDRVIRAQQDLIRTLESNLQPRGTQRFVPSPAAFGMVGNVPLGAVTTPSPTYVPQLSPQDPYSFGPFMALAESPESTNSPGPLGSASDNANSDDKKREQ